MQIYLHPGRHEALTLTIDAYTGAGTLTRWSLAAKPATRLIQRELSFGILLPGDGQILMRGGITGAPDGKFFVLAHGSSGSGSNAPDILELCDWDDLSPVHMLTTPEGREFTSLANSPNGRWLVVGDEAVQRLLLFDRISGELISDHFADGECISGLAFDPTSTFVAGITAIGDSGPVLKIWRCGSAAHFIPLAQKQVTIALARFEHYRDILLSLDHVYGEMALTVLHWDLELPRYCSHPEGYGLATFSTDSRFVIFSLLVDSSSCLLTAYEVASGRHIWSVCKEGGSLEPFVFTLDGSFVVCGNGSRYFDRPSPGGKSVLVSHGSDLLVYRMDDGVLVQRLPLELDEPLEGLVLGGDGVTLWLTTQNALISYQLPCWLHSRED